LCFYAYLPDSSFLEFGPWCLCATGFEGKRIGLNCTSLCRFICSSHAATLIFEAREVSSLVRTTGSSPLIPFGGKAWGEIEGLNTVARNWWMCTFYAKRGARARRSNAKLTPRCGGT